MIDLFGDIFYSGISWEHSMAASQAIVNHVISYFVWRFDRLPSEFDRKTKVRSAFRNAAAWRALANTFNQRPWMKALGVTLQPSDFDELKTIGDLADFIAEKAGAKASRLNDVRFLSYPVKTWPLT